MTRILLYHRDSVTPNLELWYANTAARFMSFGPLFRGRTGPLLFVFSGLAFGYSIRNCTDYLYNILLVQSSYSEESIEYPLKYQLEFLHLSSSRENPHIN
jgi:hypothetical protein